MPLNRGPIKRPGTVPAPGQTSNRTPTTTAGRGRGQTAIIQGLENTSFGDPNRRGTREQRANRIGRAQFNAFGDTDLGPHLEDLGELTIGDLGGVQLSVNEQRRRQELERLEGAGRLIGTSPESTLARELAVQRARDGGALSDDVLARQQGAIRSQGAVTAEDTQRSQQERFAQQGISGFAPILADLRLQQQLNAALGGQLAQNELGFVQSQEQAQRANLQQLFDIAAEEEQRRLAVEAQIAEVYGRELSLEDLVAIEALGRGIKKRPIFGGQGR